MDLNSLLIGGITSGFNSVIEYLAQHVITCLIPAFFIAGAIAAIIKKDAILKYFGPDVDKKISYTIAAISGTVLAVCSCTILPLFAGIYKKGSGIGPATTFLYSGPAISILAIVYTAQVLGFTLGLARGVAAIITSILIGLLMSIIFKDEVKNETKKGKRTELSSNSTESRPIWVDASFFVMLVLILIFGTAKIDILAKFAIVYILTLGVAVLLIYYFDKQEVTDWGNETLDLSKKIFPILIAGTFIVGLIAYYLPPETFRPYLGGNSLTACFTASIVGAILYMPTLLEIPIIGTTFGYSSGIMGGGPALSLLLAGPGVSLPSLVVIYRILGAKKTAVYISLVIIFSTLSGFIYGNIVG